MTRARLLCQLLFTVILAMLPTGFVQAGESKTNKVATWKVENTTGEPAKGYAVFVNVAPEMIDASKSKGKTLKNIRVEPRGNLGTLVVFEDETGIASGAQDSFQLYFKNLPKTKKEVKFSRVSTLRAGTGRDGRVTLQEVPRVGLSVVKDPLYSILNFNGEPLSPDPENPDPVPITISGLEYLSNVAEVEDTTEFLDLGNSYGFTPLGLDPFVILGNSESDLINIPGPVDFHNWFYVRGIFTITQRNAMGELVTQNIPFVHGQTEYVPEPAALLLAGIGGMATCGIRRRRNRALRPRED